MSKLQEIADVEIDPQGIFKYILINVSDPSTAEEKKIVRGFARYAYHADILDSICPTIEKHGLKLHCLGGGRIEHEPHRQRIFVYGYSQGYGQADHSISVDLIKKAFPNYKDITFSNEGY